MIDKLKYVFFGIYGVMLLIYILGSAIGASKVKEYSKVELVAKNPLNALCGIGYFLLALVGYSYTSKLDLDRIDMCRILHGQKDAAVIYRVNVAQKVSAVYIIVMISMLLYPISGEIIMLALGVLLAVGIYASIDSDIVNACGKFKEDILRDFPAVLSKLALLINAGMTMRNAWTEVARRGEGRIYKEMRQTLIDMSNGISEREAYLAFSDRCGVPEVRKFAATLVQNLERGVSEVAQFLIDENAAGWELRKHMARRAGERAKGLLLIPILIMFVGIFVLILVPMLGNMGY